MEPASIFVFDTAVRIPAHSLEDAQEALAVVAATVETMAGAALVIFDAYGIEDSRTGAEVRAVR